MKTIKHLEKLSKHYHYYNNLAPFPIYDTEYVQDLDNKIKEMKDNKHKDYDDEPVFACRHCKSLHIINDDIDNSICMRCGSVNELKEFSNIYEYNKYITKKDND